MGETYVIFSLAETTANWQEEREPMFWSNVYGWTTLRHATRFTQEEYLSVHLPIGGEWVHEYGG